MTIVPFLSQSVFGARDIQAMSTVLDDVCGILHLPEAAAREKERLAKQIIALAREGHRDVGSLRFLMLREIAIASGGVEEPSSSGRNASRAEAPQWRQRHSGNF